MDKKHMSYLSIFVLTVTLFGCKSFQSETEKAENSQLNSQAGLQGKAINYRSLPIAKELIALTSQEGQSLAYSADARSDLLPLLSSLEWQQMQTFCGIASAVTVLNMLKIPGPIASEYNYRAFTQNNFFQDQTLKIAKREDVLKSGLTLQQLGSLLSSYGAKVVVHSSDKMTFEVFKAKAIENLKSVDDAIIVNYSRSLVFQEGGGHHSLVGAYHSKADRFLILDVAQHRYEPVWVRSIDLWNAIHTADQLDSSMWRGFLSVSKK